MTIKRLKCLLYGHLWDEIHGYWDQPTSTAHCLRCGKCAE